MRLAQMTGENAKLKETEKKQRERLEQMRADNPNIPLIDYRDVNLWPNYNNAQTYTRDINSPIDPRVRNVVLVKLITDDTQLISPVNSTYKILENPYRRDHSKAYRTNREINIATDTYNYWVDKFKNLPGDTRNEYRRQFDKALSESYKTTLDDFINRTPYNSGSPGYNTDYNSIAGDISKIFSSINDTLRISVDPYFAESSNSMMYNRNRIHSMLQALRDTTKPEEKRVTFNLPPVEPNTAINYPQTYQNIRAAHDADTSSSFFNDTDTGIRIRKNRARGLPDGMPSSVSHYYSDYSMYNSDYSTSAYRHRVKKRPDDVSTRSFMTSTEDLLKLKPYRPSDSSYLSSRDSSYASSFLEDLSYKKPKWARRANDDDSGREIKHIDINYDTRSEGSSEERTPKRKLKIRGRLSVEKNERPERKNKLRYSKSESFESSEEPQQLPKPLKRDLSIESFVSYVSEHGLPNWAESHSSDYQAPKKRNVATDDSEVSFEAPSKRKHLKSRSVLAGFYNRRVSPTVIVNANQFRRNTLSLLDRKISTGSGDMGYTGDELDTDLILRKRNR